MYEDQTQYDAARERIDNTPELEEYRDIILYDWQEGAELWTWVSTAKVDEILAWCESRREDARLQELEDAVEE